MSRIADSMLRAPCSVLSTEPRSRIPAGRRRSGRIRRRSSLVRHVEIDLVLQDFLDDDFQLVVAADIDQRPGAGVERDEPLLDQRRELEPPADLVDDLLLLSVPRSFQFL